jgi:hypothetical protein
MAAPARSWGLSGHRADIVDPSKMTPKQTSVADNGVSRALQTGPLRKSALLIHLKRRLSRDSWLTALQPISLMSSF